LDDEGFEQSPPTTAVFGISVFRVGRDRCGRGRPPAQPAAAYACGTAKGQGRIVMSQKLNAIL